MTFTFVILHYKTAKDTIDCIESLLVLNNKDNDIVNILVVDNGSFNGSLETLKKEYFLCESVFFVENNKNLGYAKGNNVGYRIAKERFGSDFVVVLNNDIVVKSKNIIQKIKELYYEEEFHIMGPDIVSMVDGGHQNPAIPTSSEKCVIAKEMLRYGVLFLLSKIRLYDLFRKRMRTKEKMKGIKPKESNRRYNCQLHGSFVVFSPKYTQNEKYAFYPETFLYCEEAILYQHCKMKQYVLIYDPEVIVMHKEDSSTSFVNNSSKAKREFVFENVIKSHKVYLDFLKDPSVWE